MVQSTKAYDKAVELINTFASSREAKKDIYNDVASQKPVSLALAILQDTSGILRIDKRLAQLCADCFMFGVYLSSGNGTGNLTANLSDEELAKRCIACGHTTWKSGMLRCKLEKCIHE